MSTTNYFVSLHYLATPGGYADVLALWHRLRQAAPVGHIPLAEARKEATRLRLPPDATIQSGDALFWTPDQANERIFIHTAQRIVVGLARQLGTDGVLKCYVGRQVAVRSWMVSNLRHYAGILQARKPKSKPLKYVTNHDLRLSLDGSFHIQTTPMPMPDFDDFDYDLFDGEMTPIAFRLADVSYVDLSPAIPVVYLGASRIPAPRTAECVPASSADPGAYLSPVPQS